MFRSIASNNFAPFGELQLTFPAVPQKPSSLAEVHLLTGVNGTGKTRILSVLSAMLGNPIHLQKRMKGNGGTASFAAGLDASGFQIDVGNGALNCSGGHQALFSTYQHTIPAFAYSGYAYLADAQVSAMGTISRPDRHYCLSFNRPETSSQILLQAITNLLFEAAVDSLNVESDSNTHSRAARLVKSLEATIFEITGTKFQFKIEQYPQISLSVVWGGTKLPFDVLPDGLRAILGWLVHALVMMDVWLQGKSAPTDVEAIFLLDEIESHLHPAWQRKILPAFQKLFPKSQIFVATHSPFVIASLNHGWIHSFKIDPNGKVRCEAPKAASAGDSYISVVEDIMGVKEWFDPETENLLADFRKQRDSAYCRDLSADEREKAHAQARQLALQIGRRSTELDFMMGKELNQMERQLTKSAEKA
jgi:hypothetical protein